MSRETTHVLDRDDAGQTYYRQVVSASELRRILRKAGELLAKPNHFTSRDEWYVE